MVTAAEAARALATAVLFAGTLLALLAALRARMNAGPALIATPLTAATAWAIAIEALSATVGISHTTLTASALLLAILAAAASLVLRQGWGALQHDAHPLRVAVAQFAKTRAWWRWPVVVSAGAASATIVASLLVAAIGAPNNVDSLGYHLPRVMWWMQLGHVGPYVTPNFSQATYPPLHEYLLLAVYGVTGSDLLLNFVQWSAGLFAIAAVTYSARLMFDSRLAVTLTFILVSTIPTGIVEMTTTQSDWVAALWPLLALSLVLARARQRIALIPYVILLGLAGALTMATKPTGAIAVGLIVLLASWWEFHPPVPQAGSSRPGSTKATLAILAATATGALIGGLPQVLRNLASTGSLLGVKTDIFVASANPAYFWQNTIRTLANNIGIPAPFNGPINEYLPQVLAALGVPWTDPDAIHLSNVLSVGLGRNEDMTTNPIHFLLGFVVAIAVLFMPSAPRMLRCVTGLGLASIITLAGVLQWQIWSTRFFLAGIAMLTLPLAWLAAKWIQSSTKRPNARGIVATALLTCSALYGLAVAVAQEYRPLIGPGSILTTPRDDQYFRVLNRPGAPDTPESVMRQRIQELSKLPVGSTIGLADMYGQEYIVWRFLNPDGRYRFVNLIDLSGARAADLDQLDGVMCERDCNAN